jgi:predicted Zn-dependent peptidase
LVKKWFGDIPKAHIERRTREKEDVQTEAREKTIVSKVPLDAFYFSFKMSERSSDEFYRGDLISDVLGRGDSSWLYTELVVNKNLLSEVSSYVTGDRDEGMFVISGKLNSGVEMKVIEEEIWDFITQLKTVEVDEKDLLKAKNKFETAHVYGELSVLNKAMNLGYSELLGDVEGINTELEKYASLTAKNLMDWANTTLSKEKVCKLYYKAEQNG